MTLHVNFKKLYYSKTNKVNKKLEWDQGEQPMLRIAPRARNQNVELCSIKAKTDFFVSLNDKDLSEAFPVAI